MLPPGLEQGFEEDELLALELGVSSIAGLSEAQKVYKDKIKQKLAQVRGCRVCLLETDGLAGTTANSTGALGIALSIRGSARNPCRCSQRFITRFRS